MAFPIIVLADRQTAEVASSTANWTLTYPTNLVSGDFIRAIVAVDGSPTPTWPDDWSYLRYPYSGGHVTLVYAWKFSDGSETGPLTLAIGATEGGIWVLDRITGAHASTAPEGAVTASEGADNIPDSPSLSPSWGVEDTLFESVFAMDHSNNRAVTVYPASYTLYQTSIVGTTNSSTNLGASARALAAGSDNPGAYTMDGSDQWVCNTFAVRPGVVVGVTHAIEIIADFV